MTSELLGVCAGVSAMYAISIAPSRSAGGTFFIEGLEHVGGRILVWSSPDDPSTFERSRQRSEGASSFDSFESLRSTERRRTSRFEFEAVEGRRRQQLTAPDDPS